MTGWWQMIDWNGPWQALAACGAGLLVLAVAALLAERRRHARHDLDRMGCMPWTMIYVLSFFMGIMLAGTALKTALH